MKKSNFISFGLVLLAMMTISTSTFSQTRLPDGTIIYKDGSRRLPNGSIVYPNNTTRTTGNRTIDGILHPNRTTTTVTRYPRRNYDYNRNRNWMPPGQAKKIYGGSARDYAPGQNKGRNWNRNNDNRKDRGDHGDHGDHGNGHGHGRDK